MSAQMTSPAFETVVLRAVYAALNRNDIPAMVVAFDPQIEWTETFDPTGGTYRGLAEVEAHFSQARALWAEGACEPDRFIVAGDKIIVFVRVRVKLKRETEWREGRLGDVYNFRGGKIVEWRSFLDQQQALAWAGAKGVNAV